MILLEEDEIRRGLWRLPKVFREQAMPIVLGCESCTCKGPKPMAGCTLESLKLTSGFSVFYFCISLQSFKFYLIN